MTTIYSVKMGSNLNAKTTKEELIAMAKNAGSSIEFFPARSKANAEILRLNGHNVAYCFKNQVDAIVYAGGQA